ncbi:MAG: DHHW family protein [Oscillospiraceae bacterium]
MKNSFKSIFALALTASILSGCNIVVDNGGSSDTTSGGASQTDTSSTSSESTSSTSTESSGESTTTSTESTTESTSSSEPAPVDPNNDPNEGEMSDTVMVMGDGRGLVCFYGNNSGAERYASYLNKFKEKLGDDVNVYTLVAPTAGTYYMPDKYKKSLNVSDEKKVIAHISESLVGITNVEVCDVLGEHKDEHIYSSTDHHWQQLGAYYAAQEFAKQAGVPFADLSTYEKVVKEGYVGTLYGYSGENPKIRDNPEEFVYYIPPVQTTVTQYSVNDLTAGKTVPLLTNIDGWAPVSWYLVFGTDDIVRKIETPVKNGRKLLIVKDSYGNALVPNLTSSFEEIWVTDMRYFNGSITEFAKEKGITDLLFTMNSFSATGSNQNKLPTIL